MNKQLFDEELFSLKYNIYSNEIFSIAYGYTHNKADAEDIVQNVFMKYLSLNKDFPSLQDEKYYLIRLTINESINIIKKNKKTIVLENYDTLVDESINNSKYQYIHEIIDKLPNKYKTIILLFYFQEYSSKEISSMLEISEALVRKRLERARKIIKERIIQNE